MLPLQDVLPSRQAPRVTLTFIGVSLLACGYQLTLSTPELRSLIVSYGLVPAHTWWPSLITSSFISPGLVSTFASLLALWIFGDNVEDRLGAPRYAALLLVSGAVSAFAGIALDPTSRLPLLGPAGAIGGAIGGHLALFPRSRILVLIPVWRGLDVVEVPALLVVAFWLLFQGAGQLGGPGALHPAATTMIMPVVGCAAGAVVAWFAKQPDRMRAEWWSA